MNTDIRQLHQLRDLGHQSFPLFLIPGWPSMFGGFTAHIAFQQDWQYAARFTGEAIQPLGQLETVNRMHQIEMPRYSFGFPALDMTDHMPLRPFEGC